MGIVRRHHQRQRRNELTTIAGTNPTSKTAFGRSLVCRKRGARLFKGMGGYFCRACIENRLMDANCVTIPRGSTCGPIDCVNGSAAAGNACSARRDSRQQPARRCASSPLFDRASCQGQRRRARGNRRAVLAHSKPPAAALEVTPDAAKLNYFRKLPRFTRFPARHQKIPCFID
jgi:hypothetical protein